MRRTIKLKIGFLFPYSGLFRKMKSDLMQGLETAFQKTTCSVALETYTEYVQAGGSKMVEEGLKKLFCYEQVDLVIGIIGTKVALNMVPLVEANRTAMLVINLGADLPTRSLSSDYLFYNSAHLWKSEWAMGKWAQDRFGGNPSISMSIYEGGYDLSGSFQAGAIASGAQSVTVNLVRNIGGPPQTDDLIKYLQIQQPLYTHGLLSGREGEQFLELFAASGHAADTGLTVSPFMAEDGLLNALLPGLELYNAMTWSRGLENRENQAFVHLYEHTHGEAPNIFSLLSYEAGLSLAMAIGEIPGQVERESLACALSRARPIGPRGQIALSTRPLRTSMPVYIRKPVTGSAGSGPQNRIVGTATDIEWNDPVFAVDRPFISGWQNPYLCI